VSPILFSGGSLPLAVLKIIMDNAMHNATTHGKRGGPLAMTVDVAAPSSQADDLAPTMLSIRLRNNPGEFHTRALKLQAEHGPNFLLRDDCELDVTSIASKQSTFLGRHEMREAAAAMDASIELLFVGGEDPHTVFSLTTELRPCLAEPPAPGAADGDLVALRPGTLLICADDDLIARKGYKPLIQLSQAEDSMVLGASYEEAASVVEKVLTEAAARGDGNVVCVLDQNMEYAAGTILGTDLTVALREAGFKGVIAIRSANDDPANRKMYREIGASGTLGKDLKAAGLVRGLLKIYSRVFRMGLCE